MVSEVLHGTLKFGGGEVVGMTEIWKEITEDDEEWPMVSLINACIAGDIEKVRELVACGVRIHNQDRNWYTPLIHACSRGHLEIVNFLLTNGANLNEKDHLKNQPLHCACFGGYLDVVQALVAHGAGVNSGDRRSPLISAIMCGRYGGIKPGGHLGIVQFLLSNGACVDQQTCDGYTALHAACQVGNLEVVKLLLSNGANVDVMDSSGVQPLVIAFNEGTFEIQRTLVDHNASMDDVWEYKPLFQACIRGQLETVQLLLSLGAEVDTEWDRELHVACQRGYYFIAQLLVANGAPVDARCCSDRTAPLHVACNGGHFEILQLLLSSGAPVDDLDARGSTALHYACERGSIEMVNLLVSYNADLNVKNRMEMRPLHIACERGHHEIQKILINQGASVVEEEDDSLPITCMPMHRACEDGNNEIVELLLSKGADVKMEVCGMQPLDMACAKGHLHIVQTLLLHGANIQYEDSQHMGPLAVACFRGNVELVQTLLSHAVRTVDASDLAYPLGRACFGGNLEVVKTLLAYGAKPDIQVHNITGFPLHTTTSEEVARTLILHGADVSIVNEDCVSALKTSAGFMNRILLDYGAGSKRPCGQQECKCQTTELMCTYMQYREEAATSVICMYNPHLKVGEFESYFIKTEAAKLRLNEKEHAIEPRFLNSLKRDAFRAECNSELEQMKKCAINNTSTTYYDLLSLNTPPSQYQPVVENFSIEECLKKFTIYGDMTICSFLEVRRLLERRLLTDQSTSFFLLTQPTLLPECAEQVMAYLSNEDLNNLIEVAQTGEPQE